MLLPRPLPFIVVSPKGFLGLGAFCTLYFGNIILKDRLRSLHQGVCFDGIGFLFVLSAFLACSAIALGDIF